MNDGLIKLRLWNKHRKASGSFRPALDTDGGVIDR